MLTYPEVQLFTCPGGGKNKQTIGQDLHTCVHTHGACGADPLLGRQLLSMKLNTACVCVYEQQHPTSQRITLSVPLNGSDSSVTAAKKIIHIRYSQGDISAQTQVQLGITIYYRETGSFSRNVIKYEHIICRFSVVQ